MSGNPNCLLIFKREIKKLSWWGLSTGKPHTCALVILLMGTNVPIFGSFLLGWSDSPGEDSISSLEVKALYAAIWEARWGQAAGEFSIQNAFAPLIYLFFRTIPRSSALPRTPDPDPLVLTSPENNTADFCWCRGAVAQPGGLKERFQWSNYSTSQIVFSQFSVL